MTKHKVEIYWSQPDNAFIAEAPDLPGCCADGPTRQQAVANLETIIEEWTRPQPNSGARSQSLKPLRLKVTGSEGIATLISWPWRP